MPPRIGDTVLYTGTDSIQRAAVITRVHSTVEVNLVVILDAELDAGLGTTLARTHVFYHADIAPDTWRER